MAQRILSSVSPSSFLDMIAREDKNALSKIKGIGKKTVEQLIISLKDKATALQALSETSSFSSAEQEAFLALQTLGVKESAAKEAIKKAKKNLDSEANTATLISEALKHI
jgi:Holliday junction DNA helicase RuvA